MPTPNVKKSPYIKFVKGALDTPTVKVDDPAGGVDSNWKQVDLVNPPDSNIVVVAGLAEHTSMSMFEHYFWYHQVALIIEGEMVIQDLDTGGVYKAKKGDLFYWAPGLKVMIGGKFKAYFVKTPVPLRWVNTPNGKKEIITYMLENETMLPGTPPVKTVKKRMERAYS